MTRGDTSRPRRAGCTAGTFVVAHGCYNGLAVISVNFADLPDSPWFPRALAQLDLGPGHGARQGLPLDGTYCGDREDRFNGELQPVDQVATRRANKQVRSACIDQSGIDARAGAVTASSLVVPWSVGRRRAPLDRPCARSS